MFTATSEITEIPKVGAKYAGLLQNLGVTTVKDFLFHIPSKYKDTKDLISIMDFKMEQQGAILATVNEIKNVYLRTGKVLTRAKLYDETGEIAAVWFNQPYLQNTIKRGARYIFSGKISPRQKTKDISNPEYEEYKEDEEQTHLGKITPYYPETAGISSKWIRQKIMQLLPYTQEIIDEPISQSVLEKYSLTTLNDAIQKVHNPKDEKDIDIGRKRLEFDEMLSIALKMEITKKDRKDKESVKLNSDMDKILDFIKNLPYELTPSQNNAAKEILDDIAQSTPMYRLLNGDVGSGKTIVAAIAMYCSILSGYTALLMAPTSILANQHYENFKKLFEHLNVNVELRTSSKKITKIEKASIIIGTHALLYDENLPTNIGLVVVDEQHRFGVKQREYLRQLNEGKTYPHYLSMSATPIPRTLTNILFGDMEVSFLNDMPKNRIPIETHYVPFEKKDACYEWIKDKIVNSNYIEQAFIIFPLVEESEKVQAKAAKKEFENLQQTFFKDLKIALLHGQMKEKEKDEILEDFKSKKYSVLVATPVVEVGIDIKDATMMVIENSERFGLAQLHQFRGRVGRGDKQSYCFVLSDKNVEENALERLKYFSAHSSGFDVSEYDLERRGPGEVFGTRQSGVPNFKVASITNLKLLIRCREIAKDIIQSQFDTEYIFTNLFK